MTAKIKSLSPRGAQSYRHKPRGISDRAFAKVYWPYLPVVLIAGALLTFGAQAGALHAAVASHQTKVLDYATSMQLSALLADSNAARAANGAGSLSLNGELDAAAQAQANDMATRNYWSHYTPEGSPPWVWVTNQGYAYQALAQNLAAGFSDEQSTIDGWMASPDHRTNMLNPIYSDVGFGSANNPNYTSAGGGPMTIVVAFYGEPQQAAPAPSPAPASSTPASTPQAASNTPTTPAAAAPSTSATPASTAPASNPASQAPTTAQAKNTLTSTQVGDSQSSRPGITLAYRTSRAQLAFARLPQSSFATTLVVIAGLAAVGMWLSRHLLAFRRVLVYGEEFVVRHPLMDVGLLTIAAFSYMLSQTAGFIQ